MKIVFLSVWFSERMGYIENCLPKALAILGHEVHVISSTAQVYFNDPQYRTIYEPYLGKCIMHAGTKEVDGFRLHRIPFGMIKGKMYLKQLRALLQKIEPDIVQTFDAFSFVTLQSAFYKTIINYKLFTANHTVASVFPLLNGKQKGIFPNILFFLTRTIPGRVVSYFTTKCYPATVDALDIAVTYYGVPRHKVKIACLGVDTDFFRPLPDDPKSQKNKLLKREACGINPRDILCIYTGRFTEGKNPLCLAKAVEKLANQNRCFKAIFLGSGPQAEDIKACRGSIVHDFVPYHDLPTYYNIADIGVWPRQESTSMLDAAACGLPIIISNNVKATERVEGNGLVYFENDVNSMMDALIKLEDEKYRRYLGECGAIKIQEKYSWLTIARERASDYEAALNQTTVRQ